MKKTIFYCDRCGEQIPDVVYVLNCYAYAVQPRDAAKYFTELDEQNSRQNAALAGGTDRHLCLKCKDEITDGIFIV